MASSVALIRRASTTRANRVQFVNSGAVAIASRDKGFIDLSRDQCRRENDRTAPIHRPESNLTAAAIGDVAREGELNEEKNSARRANLMTGPNNRAKAMTRAKYRPDRSSGRTMQTNIAEKLQAIVTDIKERGHANLTRLTVLKKWFEAPGRITSFGTFIAIQASRQTRKTTKEAEQLLCQAREILAEVEIGRAHV